MSKEFFQTHGQRVAREQIRSLRTSEGRLCVGPKEVMETTTDFYLSLFQQEQPAPRARWYCKEV